MSQDSTLVLGIDGGGSSTTAWLANRNGIVLGRGKAGPSNAKAIGPERACEALGTAIDAAFNASGIPKAAVAVACFGLAGFDRPAEKTVVENWSRSANWAKRMVLVNDGDLVIAAGTPDGWGVGLIAGTGSIAVGRTEDGRTARAGGWGHLIGDEGSAYGVAIAGLRAVARRADGRATVPQPDHFTERVCQVVGVASPGELVTAIYSGDWDRSRIAGLAPEIASAAADDPILQTEIILQAAHDLADLVVAVIKALGWADQRSREWPGPPTLPPLPLGMAGGFLLGAERLRERVLQILASEGFPCAATPVVEPAQGAITLARRALEP